MFATMMATIAVVSAATAAAFAILLAVGRQQRDISELRSRLDALPPPPPSDPATPRLRFGEAYQTRPGIVERLSSALGSPVLLAAAALVVLAATLTILSANEPDSLAGPSRPDQ